MGLEWGGLYADGGCWWCLALRDGTWGGCGVDGWRWYCCCCLYHWLILAMVRLVLMGVMGDTGGGASSVKGASRGGVLAFIVLMGGICSGASANNRC